MMKWVDKRKVAVLITACALVLLMFLITTITFSRTSKVFVREVGVDGKVVIDVHDRKDLRIGMVGDVFEKGRDWMSGAPVACLRIASVKKGKYSAEIIYKSSSIRSGQLVDFDIPASSFHKGSYFYKNAMRCLDFNDYFMAEGLLREALKQYELIDLNLCTEPETMEEEIRKCGKRLEWTERKIYERRRDNGYMDRVTDMNRKKMYSTPNAVSFGPSGCGFRAAALLGNIAVKVNVQGALIALDGRVIAGSNGSDVVSIINVPRGKHLLSVIKEGYVSDTINKPIRVRYVETSPRPFIARLIKPVPQKARSGGYFDKAGMEYKLIPAGEFDMGKVPGDEDARPYETPQHHVIVSNPFWMSTTEVTFEAYRTFCRITGRRMPRWQLDGHPVTEVSWSDAQAFCRWVGGRLPMEAEWEYVAREGKANRIYIEPSEHLGTDDNLRNHTMPGGASNPNAFGIYDMYGNVREWCSDWFDTDYYMFSADRDPQGPAALGRWKIVRGLDYGFNPHRRQQLLPDRRLSSRGLQEPCRSDQYTGFRVVRDSPPPFRGNRQFLEELSIEEEMAYERAEKENSVEGWRMFLNLYPGASRRNEIDERISVIHRNEWQLAEKRQAEAAKQLGLASEIENEIGMRFRLIPDGSFRMGTNYGEPDEAPIHRVAISKPFYMSMYEVTQAQYETIMNENPSGKPGWRRPVENVDWEKAVEFCQRLSDATGDFYRLPTEAEWEYACRAGTSTEYFCGDKLNGDFVWLFECELPETKPVGGRRSNAWGLFDMHAGVEEWCSDRYAEDHYRHSPEADPKGPHTGLYRMLRGGHYSPSPHNCLRSAGRKQHWQRIRYSRGDVIEGEINRIGFRVIRLLSEDAREMWRQRSEREAKEQKAFERAKNGDTIDSWSAFVFRYPDSSLCKYAIERLDTLKKNESNQLASNDNTSNSECLPAEITNSIGMKMRLIRSGSFSMGQENPYHEDENTVHKVVISKPFYMGAFEVTVEQYERIMSDNTSDYSGSKLPAVVVTWFDAVEFCRKLSDLEDCVYRLPTEAEWEYACRAGSAGEYFWGNGVNSIYMNMETTLQPTGSYEPNAWGLFDMSGNAREWCFDWYDEGHYSRSTLTDPMGPSEGEYKVVRGGAFDDVRAHWGFHRLDPITNEEKRMSRIEYFGDFVRSAKRDKRTPTLLPVKPSFGGNVESIGNIGFRVVREVGR